MLKDHLGIILDLLEDFDTPVAKKAIDLINQRAWVELADLAARPSQHPTAEACRDARFIGSILKKCKNLPMGASPKTRRHAALETWFAAEKQCKLTNERFRNHIEGFFPDVAPRVVEFLYAVKRDIARVLGRVPVDLVEAKHGKGATLEDKGRLATVMHKMASRPTITPAARDLLPLMRGSAWERCWFDRQDSDPKTVRGNRFATVEKNSLTDRSIGIEPSLNIFLQLGVGRVIRRRLKWIAKIDLDEGQSLHRELARLGSVLGHLATIDLSSASDTVARELIKFLLPDDWYALLDSLRSPVTTVGRRTFLLEKFSSMGNGFTFELETLIFWAIARQFDPGAKVYGDDIIVNTDAARDTIAALAYCGFKTNIEKTFVSGPFRESCGGDFFNGVNVTPFYLKEEPNEPQQWVGFANGIRLHGTFNGACELDSRYRRAYLRCLDNIPSDVRKLKGPERLGDAVLHGPREHWTTRRVNHVDEIQIRVPIGRAVSLRRFRGSVQLASALYGVGSRGQNIRGQVEGYKTQWVPIHAGQTQEVWVKHWLRKEGPKFSYVGTYPRAQ